MKAAPSMSRPVCGLLALIALGLVLLPPAAGAKTVRGTDHADRLTGTTGADLLLGRGGADVIDGDGRDRVLAGAGNDRVRLNVAKVAFRVDCGSGRDRVTVRTRLRLTRRTVQRRLRRCETLTITRVNAGKEDGAAPAPTGSIPPSSTSGGGTPVTAGGGVGDPTRPVATTAGDAHVFLSPAGSDAANCSSTAPCQTFARGFAAAAPGEIIDVRAGAYPRQDVPAGSKPVVFRGLPGNRIARLMNGAAKVTFDGLDVDAGGAVGGDVSVFGNDADDVTFMNGRIGDVVDQKGALVMGAHFTFDNVYFHDALLRGNGVHMECVFALQVQGMTVRNSTFHNCAIMDLFFNYGFWWDPLPPAYQHVTIENNVFEHVMNEDETWNAYPLYIGNTGSATLDGWVVRHNTFEQHASAMSTHTSAVNSRWVGNLGGWECIPGMVYRRNVGKQCDPSDKAVSPDEDSRTTIAPLGWAAPRNGDFHLSAGSPAIGAADPSDTMARDRDGRPRDGAPDAGAYEY